MQQTLRNCEKKLGIAKGQLIKVQYDNQNLSMKVNQAKQPTKKI
jgi:hypothetical protein